MKFLYKSLEAFTLGNSKYFVEAKTDGSQLYVAICNDRFEKASVSGTIKYNGETQSFSLANNYKAYLTFDYEDSVKNLTVKIGSASINCEWNGSFSDPDPVVNISSYTGIRVNSYFEAYFTYSGSSRNNALVAPMISYKTETGWTPLSYSASKRTGNSYSARIFAGVTPGTLYRVVLLFACYGNSYDSLEDYIGLTEYEFPIFTLTDEYAPFAPCGLEYEPTKTGVPFTVSWNEINDPTCSDPIYVLYRYINNDYGTEVYRGRASSFTDVLPGGTDRVRYEVCSFDGYSYSTNCRGETFEVEDASNVFIGINGQAVQAAAVYIGKNGVPVIASAVSVGE